MLLEQLSIKNFRNIESLELSPNPGLNIISGNNAQGKTSLAESVFYLSALKSFRTAKTQDLVRFDQDGFQIDAIVRSPKQSFLKVRWTPEKKSVFVDEKPARPGAFIKKVRTVVFSPESLSTIKHGPDERRVLIDQAAFQIFDEAASSQTMFDRALKQRNSCLKQMKKGLIPISQGRQILESLRPNFVQAASQVSYFRLKIMDAFRAKIIQTASEIMGENVDISFEYRTSNTSLIGMGLQDLITHIDNMCLDPEIRTIEEALGSSIVGPHRHELTFLFNGKDSKIFCSQGQQRALILSFKIAEIVYHDEAFNSCPILLLDDVLSEFDGNKRDFLVEFLQNCKAQTFLTTTDQMPKWPRSSNFQMNAGKIM